MTTEDLKGAAQSVIQGQRTKELYTLEPAVSVRHGLNEVHVDMLDERGGGTAYIVESGGWHNVADLQLGH